MFDKAEEKQYVKLYNKTKGRSMPIAKSLSSKELQLIKWAYEQGYSRGKVDGLDGVFLQSQAVSLQLEMDLEQLSQQLN
ncbi:MULTISPECIES: hypothetical protein [Pseudoalteromonas]|uniref:Uncharacterized protein n=1 Tax=Pseudoalteromonas piscicida TaxID=43662 RepID=A0ABM6NHR9_PSEO7|nr:MULTISPECIES: hypothetical protein [Pseudoalteromonas]ATD08351.1 hypothetical protein PPIS_a3584 [Pseudoalteromonas piscicida]KJZ03823.1 hypothetical protein TW73_06160 [Pseudoalteromonas piscicida]MCO7200349.1 hypothetical protein [Pseudoalteromonas sp. OANN1]TMN45139.1 hypothetical protein CWC03_02585 [Pseudoalteromonas sp. S2755]WPU30398.1 hypothetical protein SIO17_14905 [Pseudoalteromonas piscicida]